VSGRRALARFLVTLAVAAAIGAALFAAGASMQGVALRRPSPASLVAIRAASWLLDHRLVDSVFRIGAGPAVHGRCLQAWFGGARGAVLHLDDGLVMLAVPPHRLESSGGTASERSLSPLVLLELGGCPRVLGRRLETLAQRREGLELIDGARPALRLALQGTRLTLRLEPKTHRPVGLDVAGRRVRGSSTIRFVRLTPGLKRRLLR
jgi:hypothetical protein